MVSGFEDSGALGSSAGREAGENAERSSRMHEGGGKDSNQKLETQKVGDLDGEEFNHGNQKILICLSAFEDSSVQTKVIDEDAMVIDGKDYFYFFYKCYQNIYGWEILIF